MKGLRPLNFVCPECGNETLVVTEELWESSEIVGFQSEAQFLGLVEVTPDRDYVYLRRGDVVDSEVTATLQYECGRCQFEIGNTEEEAIKWLNMFTKEEPDV